MPGGKDAWGSGREWGERLPRGLDRIPTVDGEKQTIEESGLGQVLNDIYVRGHFPVVFKLHPSCFGHPISRPRYYIPMVASFLVRELALSETKFHTLMVENMDRVAVHGLVPIESFLLPDDHPSIIKVIRDAECSDYEARKPPSRPSAPNRTPPSPPDGGRPCRNNVAARNCGSE